MLKLQSDFTSFQMIYIPNTTFYERHVGSLNTTWSISHSKRGDCTALIIFPGSRNLLFKKKKNTCIFSDAEVSTCLSTLYPLNIK